MARKKTQAEVWNEWVRSKDGASQHKKFTKKSEAAVRCCLGCGAKFNSAGLHNRICCACKNTAAWKAGEAGDYSNGGSVNVKPYGDHHA